MGNCRNHPTKRPNGVFRLVRDKSEWEGTFPLFLASQSWQLMSLHISQASQASVPADTQRDLKELVPQTVISELPFSSPSSPSWRVIWALESGFVAPPNPVCFHSDKTSAFPQLTVCQEGHMRAAPRVRNHLTASGGTCMLVGNLSFDVSIFQETQYRTRAL